ncbi:hypothetical protein J0A68_21750 [Algoriphagus sp. H41]|uniref:Uncharacterized protein n=1 Tax=Algoriphagus oliviformis TaxID=2811231 RepID=A0ABS3CBN8_9BACT|nr:hypothetical protein [Algoriphagus oliviformis]MBN7813595.1 hypothetical protein [Algoriphagus oliviformis]
MASMRLYMETNQEIPKELINWSKWMVGVNFSAATGCIVVLRDVRPDKSAPLSFWLFTAISLFVLTVLTSIIFNLILSLEVKKDFVLKKKHLILAGLQLGFFSLALIALLAWIKA